MSSPWGKTAAPVESLNFAEIMSEEYAHRLQDKEMKKYQKICDMADRQKQANKAEYKESGTVGSLWDDVPGTSSSPQNKRSAGCFSYSDAAKLNTSVPGAQDFDDEWEDCSSLIKEAAKDAVMEGENLSSKYLNHAQEMGSDDIITDSDEVIALLLQSQFDHEYNKELERIEQQRNQGKVSISLDKFKRMESLAFLSDSDDYDEEEDELTAQKRDWDRFETNAKKLDNIPKCGFKIEKSGEKITKHDEELCGVRNACRVMSFPPEFPTGDGASFDMKLCNKVFNQLKTYSQRGAGSMKKNKLSDRRENVATAEMGIDERTRLILYKLINNQILEQINGIISTGKEAIILHADSYPDYAEKDKPSENKIICTLLPKECAIKIFKTTLNEFKQRDRFIKDDYRFKGRFSKQNQRVVINMWAEKEMHNMMLMKNIGINCPDVVVLKQHVLLMSFIGDNGNAAPKLKDAQLSNSQLQCAYDEIVDSMHKLYNKAELVHADLSEYNILWYDGKCWFIDVAQSVKPNHPSALEFLMRDCDNIITFFTKRGLSDIFTNEQLFEHITSLDAKSHNVAMLERIHYRGASVKEATAPNQEECPDELKPLSYPFDLAWEMSLSEKQKEKTKNIVMDNAAAAMKVLSINYESEEESKQPSVELNAKTSAATN